MTSRRSVPCSRCRAIYTFHGVCENCSGSGAEELPPAEDRFADLPKRRAVCDDFLLDQSGEHPDGGFCCQLEAGHVGDHRHRGVEWARKPNEERKGTATLDMLKTAPASPLLCKQCGGVAEEERRCYATPVCFACLPPPKPLPVVPRRQAPPPVMPQVGRHVRATLPTLDDTIRIGEPIGEILGVSVDRHVAINKLIDFVTAEGTTDSAVAALLSEAERLKGAA